MPDELEQFKSEVLEVLGHCRTDRIKPVRDASLEAINIFKNISEG